MKSLILALFVLLLAFAAPSYAQEDLTPAKKADIHRLLEVTGATNISQMFSQAVVRQMTEAIKKTRPDIPAKMFDVLAEEVNKTIAESMVAKGGFVDQVVPVYHKYFSHEEIKAMVAFYQTPVGKKAIEVMPRMVQESMAIGQEWGKSLGPVIQQRIKARFEQEGVKI